MNKHLYASKINALIPEAEAAAARDLRRHIKKGGQAIEKRPALKGKRVMSSAGHKVRACGNYYGDYRHHCMWSEFFHHNMNRLAREQGLRTI